MPMNFGIIPKLGAKLLSGSFFQEKKLLSGFSLSRREECARNLKEGGMCKESFLRLTIESLEVDPAMVVGRFWNRVEKRLGSPLLIKSNVKSPNDQ
ncbi:hypothetical protein Pyn_29258 [Prunus yedoensis var. nudiflora]|uniref:Uncharacterized protein n=1 Tax=Prunus yedoensis var. nudiflora TaxID=2094558 RepID=A0A314Z0X6_PRUYE|nr:hypothetical protein Pyn_29258 [Prunus yedoensis var. nudiflora]